MINFLKKLLIIYNLKPINEKSNTFFINYKGDIYVFFKNFMFLGSLSSLNFFYLYLSFVKQIYFINFLLYQFLYLFNTFYDNLNSNNTCCMRKNIKY